MDPTFIIMWFGFILAGYSVVGNDSIQTLGTFLSSNEERPWYVLWLFAGSILAFTLLYGWQQYGGDVSYGRLEKYPFIADMSWPYLLPPLVLMVLTRTGIPVSTSFLILTFFKPKGLMDMTMKSLLGYVLAFALAILVWQVITRLLDKRFIENPISAKEKRVWTILQWSSTGFLWGQWLIQDFANIYVYLPRALSAAEIGISLTVLLLMLGYIFYSRGGSIQEIVKAKTNTVDIRSATLIDFLYALVLLFFKQYSNVPMSTTWVFLGLLAGREIAIRYLLSKEKAPGSLSAGLKYIGMSLNVLLIVLIGVVVYLQKDVSDALILLFAAAIAIRGFVFYLEAKQQEISLKGTFRMVGMDLAKVSFGLIISIVLVYIMQALTGI
ncbi:hypothetical protein [Lewinella cohaerens]|uniref:hypothetical protein n=1 Tax=Lewinella cohaerens TaxID=70995 RepID=UPI000382B121|nr:hypothetical protein [Lewinella cohaerens]